MTEMDYYLTLTTMVSNQDISTSQLEELKHQYKGYIKSRRRLDGLTNLKELINVLRKRDCINISNVGILEEIAQILQLPLPQISSPLSPRLVERIVYPEDLETPIHRNEDVFPQVNPDAKRRAYSLISREIGSKWKDLGRQLNIRQGDLDRLEEKYRNSIVDRVYSILEYAEQNCDKNYWKTKLLNALVAARRKDLKNDVEYIFNMLQ